MNFRVLLSIYLAVLRQAGEYARPEQGTSWGWGGRRVTLFSKASSSTWAPEGQYPKVQS